MRLLSAPRSRQVQRTLKNLKVSLLCSLLTFLVLRNTIGAGRFGTPAQDFEEIRQHLHHVHLHRKHARVLAEVMEEEKPRNPPLVEKQKGNVGFQMDLEGSRSAGWDEERKALASQQGSFGDSRVLLVTGSISSVCENPQGNHFLLESLKNKVDYSRIHGLEIFYNYDESMAMIPLLQKLMFMHPHVEWLWWINSEALITNMASHLPFLNYTGFSFVLLASHNISIHQNSLINLHTDSFLIRNCQWSLNFLRVWENMGSTAARNRAVVDSLLTKSFINKPHSGAIDQSALVSLLNQERELWADKVFLEMSSMLRGEWQDMAGTFEKMLVQSENGQFGRELPLVTHLMGCNPCQKMGDVEGGKCLKQMERVFKVADNQVMHSHGFQEHRVPSELELE